MILRITRSRRAATWNRGKASTFERGKDERALRLFIDDASLADEELATSIVRGFMGHPLWEVLTTAPAADPRLEVETVDGSNPQNGARVITTGRAHNAVSFVSNASQKAELASQYAVEGTDVLELTRRIILIDHA